MNTAAPSPLDKELNPPAHLAPILQKVDAKGLVASLQRRE